MREPRVLRRVQIQSSSLLSAPHTVEPAMRHTNTNPTAIILCVLLLGSASAAGAQRTKAPSRPEPLQPVLKRNTWISEWVIRVESSSVLLGTLVQPAVDSTGAPAAANSQPNPQEEAAAKAAAPPRLSVAYPLPASFAWGGTYEDAVWARVELPNGRSGENFHLSPADDGTVNMISELPWPESGKLEFTHRAMFIVQTHSILDIDEQRATQQYHWPGVYAAELAGYLDPEPFIESRDDRVLALLRRATRGRSPQSVPPYTLAKHLAGFVMHHGTPRGNGNSLDPSYFIDTDGSTGTPGNLRHRPAGGKTNDPLVLLLRHPALPLGLIRAIGRIMPGSLAQTTALRGKYPGATAPPTPKYFIRTQSTTPAPTAYPLPFCNPKDGFRVQSAAQAAAGEEVTEEGLANLLVAIYRAAGIPARLTIVIDINDVRDRKYEEPIITVTTPKEDFKELKPNARPIRWSQPLKGHPKPRQRRPIVLPAPTGDPEPEPKKPIHVGGFPAGAVFRPIVEFYLTAEGSDEGEWIPVDIVRMRERYNPAPSLETKWELFGQLHASEFLLPIAHHWVPPGHAFTNRSHIWGIWPPIAPIESPCDFESMWSFTCFLATELVNTGEPAPERSLLVPRHTTGGGQP